MKKLFIFSFLLIVLSSLVFAQPPFETLEVATTGMQIVTSQFSTVELNQQFEAQFHVFNRSNGWLMTNETVSCNLHLYNHSGNMFFDYPVTNYTDVFKITIGAGNFSPIGTYAWFIHCNDSQEGGFLNAIFYVTESGGDETKTDTTSGIAIVIFILAISLTLFIVPFFKKFHDNEVADVVIKRGCWAIATYLMMLNSTIVATIASSANLDLTNELFRYMWFFGIAGWLVIVWLGVSTIFNVMLSYKMKKEKKRSGDDD